MKFLIAEFISPKKCMLLVLIVGDIIPKSVKCIHSATKSLEFGGFRVRAVNNGSKPKALRLKCPKPDSVSQNKHVFNLSMNLRAHA